MQLSESSRLVSGPPSVACRATFSNAHSEPICAVPTALGRTRAISPSGYSLEARQACVREVTD